VSRESERAALAERFPQWETWQSGHTGIWYARRRGTSDRPVSGEDVTDLADMIERAQRIAAAGQDTPWTVPGCPACGAPASGSVWLGGSPPHGDDHWRCSGCGHDWTTPPAGASHGTAGGPSA
jgi:hypothetical protein